MKVCHANMVMLGDLHSTIWYVKFHWLLTDLQWKNIRSPQQYQCSTIIASNTFLKWLYSKCFICYALFSFVYNGMNDVFRKTWSTQGTENLWRKQSGQVFKNWFYIGWHVCGFCADIVMLLSPRNERRIWDPRARETQQWNETLVWINEIEIPIDFREAGVLFAC